VQQENAPSPNNKKHKKKNHVQQENAPSPNNKKHKKNKSRAARKRPFAQQ
jgi:hypothetical protein